jgi:hypothetical protein
MTFWCLPLWFIFCIYLNTIDADFYKVKMRTCYTYNLVKVLIEQ